MSLHIKLPAPSQSSPRCDETWVLITDATGDNSQCLALAKLLTLPFARIRIDWKACSPTLERAISMRLLDDGPGAERTRRHLGMHPPWPRLVIGSGRRSDRIGLWIKAQSAGRTKYIGIGRPHRRLDQYDLLVAPPQYALPARSNIERLRLPLTTCDGPAAVPMPAPMPWFTILIGGNAKEFAFSEDAIADAARRARAAARHHGGTVLISSSRRTPARMLAAAEAVLQGEGFIHRWTESHQARNPYRTLLARSAALFVTADSASMIADACAAGTPTYIIEYPERRDFRRRWRRRMFHAIRSAIWLCHRCRWPSASRCLDQAQEWLHNSRILRYPRDLRRLHASAYRLGLARPATAFRPEAPLAHGAGKPPAHPDARDLAARCRDLML